MHWSSPAWLLMLLPWMGGVACLLVRRARCVVVPHLRLWRAGRGATPPATGRRLPPGGVALGALAAAVAVVAAGGLVGRDRGAGVVRVVLDRSVDPNRGRPFRGMVERGVAAVNGARVQLVCVPPVAVLGESSDLRTAVAHVPPTAMDTHRMLDATVASLLREPGGGPIAVLTDRHLATADPRIVQVRPTEPTGGVGIVSMSARERPTAQVMVRLLNRSTRRSAIVRVRSAGAEVDQPVALPATAESVDVFVDVRQLGPAVSALVDDAVVDGQAWLARGGAECRVEATAGAPAAMRRMADVFNRSLAVGLAGQITAGEIAVSDRALPDDRPGVSVTQSSAPQVGPAEVKAHPVTEGVGEWAGAGGQAPPGFNPVVQRQGRTVAAVRDGPPRQVWACLDVDRASRSADWVVFLANAFRWVAGDGAEYSGQAPGKLGVGWSRLEASPAPAGVELGMWPGLYRSSEGRVIAINAPAKMGTGTSGGAPSAAVPARLATAGVDRPFGGAISVVAVALLGAAAAVWPGRRGEGKLT